MLFSLGDNGESLNDILLLFRSSESDIVAFFQGLPVARSLVVQIGGRPSGEVCFPVWNVFLFEKFCGFQHLHGELWMDKELSTPPFP